MTKLEQRLQELVGDEITGYFQDPVDGKIYIQTKNHGPIQVTKKQFIY